VTSIDCAVCREPAEAADSTVVWKIAGNGERVPLRATHRECTRKSVAGAAGHRGDPGVSGSRGFCKSCREPMLPGDDHWVIRDERGKAYLCLACSKANQCTEIGDV
jgi:hypothetical protein